MPTPRFFSTGSSGGVAARRRADEAPRSRFLGAGSASWGEGLATASSRSAARMRVEELGDLLAIGFAAPDDGLRNPSSRLAASAADVKRAFGSFSRHLSAIVSSSAGTVLSSSRSEVGCSFMTFMRTSWFDFPMKGGRPATIW